MRYLNFLSPYLLFIRPVLFRFDAEKVHHFISGFAEFIWRFRFGRAVTRFVYLKKTNQNLFVEMAGLEFANPIGLAAGFDKNALLLKGIENLGFGFAEIGTVTPRPQLGNPRPRLSRLKNQKAILNRLGFNNDGMEIIFNQVKNSRKTAQIPVGINIGKNRDTLNENAIQDYELLLKKFDGLASYFTINISSPNTSGLRDLQSGEFLKNLGLRVQTLGITRPVFVKLSPYIAEEDLQNACALCGSAQPYAGLILTNTIPTDLGGISGLPLRGPSVAVLQRARAILPKDVPIISVGGISSAADVVERFQMGANAVQLYTSLVYQGPGLVKNILKDLSSYLKKRGISSLSALREH